MISEDNWFAEYQKELQRAVSAREAGNEGMARVCARRATSIVVSEYLLRQGFTNLGKSIYDRIAIFTSLPNLDPRCKEIVSHMLVKVTPDHEFPLEADLVGEVQWLAKTLLSVNNE